MDCHRHGTDGSLNDHAPGHDDINISAHGAGGHIAADNGTLAHGPTNEYHDEFIDYLNNCCTNNDDNRCPNNDDHDKHNDHDYHDRHDNDRRNHHN